MVYILGVAAASQSRASIGVKVLHALMFGYLPDLLVLDNADLH